MREQQSKKELGSFQRSCRFPQEKISCGMLDRGPRAGGRLLLPTGLFGDPAEVDVLNVMYLKGLIASFHSIFEPLFSLAKYL